MTFRKNLSLQFCMSYLTLENGAEWSPWNVSNYQSTRSSIPEYRKSNLPCCRSLKSCNVTINDLQSWFFKQSRSLLSVTDLEILCEDHDISTTFLMSSFQFCCPFYHFYSSFFVSCYFWYSNYKARHVQYFNLICFFLLFIFKFVVNFECLFTARSALEITSSSTVIFTTFV